MSKKCSYEACPANIDSNLLVYCDNTEIECTFHHFCFANMICRRVMEGQESKTLFLCSCNNVSRIDPEFWLQTCRFHPLAGAIYDFFKEHRGRVSIENPYLLIQTVFENHGHFKDLFRNAIRPFDMPFKPSDSLAKIQEECMLRLRNQNALHENYLGVVQFCSKISEFSKCNYKRCPSRAAMVINCGSRRCQFHDECFVNLLLTKILKGEKYVNPYQCFCDDKDFKFDHRFIKRVRARFPLFDATMNFIMNLYGRISMNNPLSMMATFFDNHESFKLLFQNAIVPTPKSNKREVLLSAVHTQWLEDVKNADKKEEDDDKYEGSERVCCIHPKEGEEDCVDSDQPRKRRSPSSAPTKGKTIWENPQQKRPKAFRLSSTQTYCFLGALGLLKSGSGPLMMSQESLHCTEGFSDDNDENDDGRMSFLSLNDHDEDDRPPPALRFTGSPFAARRFTGVALEDKEFTTAKPPPRPLFAEPSLRLKRSADKKTMTATLFTSRMT